MTDEEWRVIPDFEGMYEASSLGRVRRSRGRGRYGYYERATPRILTPRPDRYGYLVVMITVNNRWRPYTVNALVCAAFHGPKPSPSHQAAHWDGNRTANVPDNLRWATPLEQAADKNRHGRTVMGERQHLAKLTAADVLAIRASAAPGVELATRYAVTPSNISAIRSRKTWKHIPLDTTAPDDMKNAQPMGEA